MAHNMLKTGGKGKESLNHIIIFLTQNENILFHLHNIRKYATLSHDRVRQKWFFTFTWS